jgi:hypothetical protein
LLWVYYVYGSILSICKCIVSVIFGTVGRFSRGHRTCIL